MSGKQQRIGRGGHAVAGLDDRRAQARAMRRTCTRCCRNDIVLRKEGRYTVANCECGGSGPELGIIAAALGVATSTVSSYLTDPDGSEAAARREKRRGDCADCGGPTDSLDKGRCRWCLQGEVSPHARERTPTRFRDFRRDVCGVPGCQHKKRAGGHVCEACAPRYAAIRRELERERATSSGRLRRGGVTNSAVALADAEFAAAMAA